MGLLRNRDSYEDYTAEGEETKSEMGFTEG